jgi:E-phenylitaconyl-CoA hydratase
MLATKHVAKLYPLPARISTGRGRDEADRNEDRRGTMPTIHYEKREHVALITMEGDTDLNLGVVGPELFERLEEYRRDDALWCAVVTGAGARAFSAGADLHSMGDRLRSSGAGVQRTLNLLSSTDFWKPVIAAVNGHAIGAGAMLALGCDIRIASENATFGIPEVKYGFVPGMGATQRLPRAIPLGPAMEMLLSGDRISAEDARTWGLVNKVVPSSELLNAATSLAERIASNPPLAVRATKEAAMRGLDMSLEQGLRLEPLLSAPTHRTEDAQEALRALAEKRRPIFKGV